MTRLQLSSGKYILLVILFITVANNQTLYSILNQRLDLKTLDGLTYFVTMFLFIVGILSSLLLIIGQKYFLKFFAVVLLLFSAGLSYFTQELGIIFDEDMVRNTFETVKDNNQQEAIELLSLPLIKHIVIYGVLPAIFFIWIRISYKPLFKEVITRIVIIFGFTILVGSLIGMNFKYISYFTRENRDIRFYNTPIFAIDSMRYYIMGELDKGSKIFNVIGEDAEQKKRGSQQIIGIMVVGETARADHFSLNGYERETNPKLQNAVQNDSLINYSNTSSCGTSTAFSVPCMFSFLERDNYSPNKAALQSNSLDVLEKAGVEVIWLDNNSSCKGVCARTGEINLRQAPDSSSPFYSKGELFDEALIGELDKALNNHMASDTISGTTTPDILIVLHTLGSHGPKYYKRYPDKFAQFQPICKKGTPQECTDEEIINTYDNTIVYTDHVLSELIRYLKTNQEDKDTFLLYASDHGESLGEKGLYLHGLPYYLAPAAQTHIPMFSWFSDAYIKSQQLDISKMKSSKDNKVSHDNITHSLLGAFGIETSLYKADLDLMKKHE